MRAKTVTTKPNVLTRCIRGCPRCGGTHHDVETYYLDQPMAPADLTSHVWDRWSICPRTGDPILSGVVR